MRVEFTRLLRLRFKERNHRLIERFAEEKERFNARGLLYSSETVKAMHKVLKAELEESGSLIVATVVDVMSKKDRLLSKEKLQELSSEALSKRKDEIESLFLSDVRHIEKSLQNKTMIQPHMSLGDFYPLQREELLIKAANVYEQYVRDRGGKRPVELSKHNRQSKAPTKVGKRKKFSGSTEADVLAASRRRCCVCAAVRSDFDEKRGQIAHLDHNPANNDPDNLAFLCLEHHDQYDSRTSQSKGLTIEEVKRYRAELLAALAVGTASKLPAAPDIRVIARPALTSVKPGIAETILAIDVENQSLSSVFIKNIGIELSDGNVLFIQRNYLTGELNTRRELRAGDKLGFYVAPNQLFGDRREPSHFSSVLVTDNINRQFRFSGKEF